MPRKVIARLFDTRNGEYVQSLYTEYEVGQMIEHLSMADESGRYQVCRIDEHAQGAVSLIAPTIPGVGQGK